jgi:hypothetical protein
MSGGANVPSYSAIHLHIENIMKRAEIFYGKISRFSAPLQGLGHKIRREVNFCAAKRDIFVAHKTFNVANT